MASHDRGRQHGVEYMRSVGPRRKAVQEENFGQFFGQSGGFGDERKKGKAPEIAMISGASAWSRGLDLLNV
jgi:hypothetical protein